MKTLLTLMVALFSLSTFSQTFTTYTTADGLLNDNALCVDVDDDDVVWFGTQAGISSFDGNTWTNYTEADGLVDNTVFAILVDLYGNIWAGTDFGLSVYDGDNWWTYTTDDGLEDNRIKCFFEDAQGLIWMGHNDGASSFDSVEFTNYTSDDGLPFGGVNHINQDSDGSIWMGTGLGGCFILDGTDFTEINEDNGLISNSVRSIAIDDDNRKWVATNEGITVFNWANDFVIDHDSVFTLPEPHEINPIEDVKIDSQGRVWAGVYVDYLVTVGGVSLYDGGVWTDFDEDDGLAGPNVSQLAIDSQDDVWVVTSTGVTKISNVPLGIQDISVSNFNIFPNPSNGMIQISNAEDEVLISNLSGQVVYNSEIAPTFINLTYLDAGMYLVKCGGSVEKLLIR